MEILKTKSTVRIIVLALLITMIVWLLPTNVPQASAKTYPQGPRYSTDKAIVWDRIHFGQYFKRSDDHGGFYTDALIWRVLSVEGDRALLLADQNVDAQKYNETYTSTSWQKCTLRSWLNGYDSSHNQDGKDYTNSNFIDAAFFNDQQAAIYQDEKHNMDKVFLLSGAEVGTHAYGFPRSGGETLTREAKNTEYAIARGVNNTNAHGNGAWWLRETAGTGQAREVGATGAALTDIYSKVNATDNGVRPALYLDLSSDVWYNADTVSSDGRVHIDDFQIVLKGDSTYTGKTQKPSVVVKSQDTTTGKTQKTPVVVKSEDATLKKGVDYTLDYENNVNIGTGVIKIQGIGDYTGNVTKTFAINPAKASLTSVKAKGKVLSTIVKQQKGGVKYEFSYKANGGKYKVLNTKESKVTFKNLKKGTTYSVRVRAYKIVDGKKFCGDYSAVKKVKVK